MVSRSFTSQKSVFLVILHWCLYDVIWESILISMGFQTSDVRSILIEIDVPLLCIFCCEVFVKTYFPWLFSGILCMRPNSEGSGIPYMNQLLGIVGVSIMFSLLDRYFMDIHIFRQEYLLPVGLHRKLWYLSTNKGHKLMGNLLWFCGTFSSFLKL